MVKSTLFFDGRVGHVSDGETTNPTFFRILRASDPKSGSAITGRNDHPRNIRNLTSESKIDTLFICVHIRRRRYLSAGKNYLRGHQCCPFGRPGKERTCWTQWTQSTRHLRLSMGCRDFCEASREWEWGVTGPHRKLVSQKKYAKVEVGWVI